MNEPEKEYSILHITVVRELSAGQRKQLKSEYSASKKMERNITWKTLAFHTGKIHEKFERKIPIFFKNLFLYTQKRELGVCVKTPNSLFSSILLSSDH